MAEAFAKFTFKAVLPSATSLVICVPVSDADIQEFALDVTLINPGDAILPSLNILAFNTLLIFHSCKLDVVPVIALTFKGTSPIASFVIVTSLKLVVEAGM